MIFNQILLFVTLTPTIIPRNLQKSYLNKINIRLLEFNIISPMFLRLLLNIIYNLPYWELLGMEPDMDSMEQFGEESFFKLQKL